MEHRRNRSNLHQLKDLIFNIDQLQQQRAPSLCLQGWTAGRKKERVLREREAGPERTRSERERIAGTEQRWRLLLEEELGTAKTKGKKDNIKKWSRQSE